MKKASASILTVLFILGVLNLNAQQLSENIQSPAIKGFYAGGQAATSGFGLNLRYMFNERFTLKSGVETLGFTRTFQFEESSINYQATFDYKTQGIFLIADFFYTRSLYLSAGAANNGLNPKVKGEALEGITYGDITIPASKVGSFLIDMKPSLSISPYVGAGFRNFIGSAKKVMFNFETGLYYMGSPKVEIEADGLLAPTADPAHGKKELLEKQFEVYKIYPVIKLNIAFKLF